MPPQVVVHGLRDLHRAFKEADKDTRKNLRTTLSKAAEPVRRDAETLAVARIPKIGQPWSRMRTGVTTTSVYVAPVKRGTRSPARRRKNLADLLMARSLEPALSRNEDETEDAVDEMLKEIADDFNRGANVGP